MANRLIDLRLDNLQCTIYALNKQLAIQQFNYLTICSPLAKANGKGYFSE